jgi:O-antigen/teichoic acid export membrane protein
MLKKFKSVIFHPFFASSAIMVIGSNFANVLAFIYHLVIGRLLGPIHYGELAAVISLATMFSAVFTFLNTVIIKFTSSAKNKHEEDYIFSWFTQKSFVLALILFVLTLILSPVFASFLHIDIKIIFILPLFLFFSILSMVYKAFLQGILKFYETILSLNLEFLLRLILGIIFVYLGLSVFGAVAGIVIAGICGFLIAFYFLRKYKIFTKNKGINITKEIFSYTLPAFIFSLTSTSFLTTDVLLAKHFLISHDAGIYASLSNLGKIILFGTAPIGAVMFPMISKRFSLSQKYLNIFFLSLILTFLASFIVLVFYQVFPTIAIKTLYGKGFLDGSTYLVWFGLFAACYSLTNLICSFYLSINKIKVIVLPVVFSILQIIGIVFIHDSLLSIIIVSLVSATLLLVSLVIYFVYETYSRNAVRLNSNSSL